MPYQIEQKTVLPQSELSRCAGASFSGIPATMCELMRDVFDCIVEQGKQPAGRPFFRYHEIAIDSDPANYRTEVVKPLRLA